MLGKLNTDIYLVFPLICLYSFVVHFGTLFKFSDNESSPGLSTVVLILIIVICIFKSIKTLFNNKIYLLILLFLTWILFASVFYSNDIQKSTKSLIIISGYFSLALSVTSIVQNNIFLVKKLWLTVTISLLISSFVSILDFVGLVNIPFCNEISLVSDIGNSEIYQASGFFSRRSAMAALYSLSITGSLIFSICEKKILKKIFYLLASLSGICCLILTHNRSGILSIFISFFLFTFFDKKNGFAEKIVMYLSIISICVIFFILLKFYFYDHLNVILVKMHLGSFLEDHAASYGKNEFEKTDYGRFEIFFYAINNLQFNPIGNGFSPMPIPKLHVANPHNIYIGLIWAGGIMGLLYFPIFLLYFMSCVIKFKKNLGFNYEYDTIYYASLFSLFSWFLNNMTHYNLNTGLAWIFFGIVISCWNNNGKLSC
jgi:hypothetical protein